MSSGLYSQGEIKHVDNIAVPMIVTHTLKNQGFKSNAMGKPCGLPKEPQKPEQFVRIILII